MKIVEQSFEYMEHVDGVAALQLIELAGRNCWKSEDKITEDSCKDFVAMLIRRGHEAMLEFGKLTVKVITDRGCYDAKTEVLTKNGWRYFNEVTEADLIACKTEEGELVFLPQETPPTKYWFNGELLHFESTSIDLLVTPDHRMWVFDYDKRATASKIWKFLPASNLKNNRYKFEKSVTSWRGAENEVTVAAHPTLSYAFPAFTLSLEQTKAMYELLGLWASDGSYREGQKYGSGSQIMISQTKLKGRQRISELCDIIGLSLSWYQNEARIDNQRLKIFVEGLFGKGAKSFTVCVPQNIKDASTEFIKRFLDGVVLGDGTVSKEGYTAIYTSSERFAGDLQELYLKIGVSANIRTMQPSVRNWKNGKASQCKTAYIVSVQRERRSTPLLNRKCAKHFGSEQHYEGYVYCLTVPNHKLYVRRNGKAVWCGNCSHEIVRHRLASYAQESTRYVNYGGKDIEFILPVEFKNINVGGSGVAIRSNGYTDENQRDQYKTWLHSLSVAEHCYNDLIKLGAKPQFARGVLPNALKTEIVMSMNFREWRHFFKLRCSKAAHPQLRALALDILKSFSMKIPVVFVDLYEEFITNAQPA